MKSINEKPSAQSIYIWNLVGSVANACLSILVLMLVTRALDIEQADIFSIAWSISQLMVTIGTFQIRTYQATDVEEKFVFRQYLLFRICTIVIMMVISVIYVIWHQFSFYKSCIVIIVCIFRAIDSMADVYEGWFQQKDRLDLAGKALTYRIIVATICFGCSLFVTRNLLISCLVLSLCYIVCFLLFDIRFTCSVDILRKREQFKKNKWWVMELFMEGMPLFINAFLMISITNEPKMIIDAAIQRGTMETGEQMIFSILFMPASVLTLAYIVFRPLLTKMAIKWNDRDVKGFLRIVATIILSLIGMTVMLLIGSAILGIPLLTMLYGVDLKEYKTELLVVILGGCFCTFSYVFDNALVVIRKQRLLIVSYIMAWLYIKLTAEKMVEQNGIMGATISYTTAMIIFFASAMLLFFVCLLKAYKKGNVNRSKQESNIKEMLENEE